MSGGWLPYHLRKNKAIDRAIFMEFLSKLNSYKPLSGYGYIGFGAIHLEDFKLIHSMFNINDLTCIEIDKIIHERQRFNLPLACINLEPSSSDSYIANFFPEKNYIVWLDYANPRQLKQQLNEFFALLQKMNPYDVVKITLNANPNSIIDEKQYRIIKKTLNENYQPEELYEKRLNDIKEKLDEYFPQKIDSSMMNKKKYPSVLCKALELAAESALNGTNNLFIPISSFVYSDSENQMLTFTGSIINSTVKDEFVTKLDLLKWDYSCDSWGPPQIIDIPDLTLKERLTIDTFLPCENPDEIVGSLNIKFDPNDEKSLEKLKNYIRYYRHYPFFSKVSV